MLPVHCNRELDQMLAFHCAPVMAGIKPANLLSLKKPIPYCLNRALARIARPFGAKGIYFFRLAECTGHVLLLVYNRRLLLDWMERAENRDILSCYGYRAGDSPGKALGNLARRFRAENGFPHEIGVFLGYPPRDVECFIRTRGKSYQLCGYWKVYGDVERAKGIFSVYDKAREYFCQKVAGGEEIYEITYGGTAI